MYKAYTEVSPKNIDTLEELDAAGIRILTSSTAYRNIFGDNESVSEVFKSLQAKMFLDNSDISSMQRVLTLDNVCTLERRTDIDIMIFVRTYFNQNSVP